MLEESVSPVSLHISSEESAEYAEQDHDKHASAMYTTPSQRLKQNENRLSHTKTRVNTIAKELGLPRRCLVENTDSSNRVDYAHCLGRSQDERTLTRLEFHWGMEKGTLNLDTRYNILFLSPKFHNCFDDGGFLLLPENRFIECYFRKSREEFPTIDDTIYNYKLIALKSMKKVPLFREEISESSPDNDDSGSDSDSSSSSSSSSDDADDDDDENYIKNFTFFRYPYKSLPHLRSHVYPRYAIVKSGETILGIKELKLIRHLFYTVLASVERPKLSLLKWVSSLTVATYGAASQTLPQLRRLIRKQAVTLEEHHSNLTKDQFSKLINEQAGIFGTVKLVTLQTLRLQLTQLEKRLKVLERQYPTNADDLALLVMVYLQWSAHPPADHPFQGARLPKSRPDDSSHITGPRSHLDREAKRKRRFDDASSPAPSGTNKRSRTGPTGTNAEGPVPQDTLNNGSLKEFERCMGKITRNKKMKSIASWVNDLPKDVLMA